MARVRIYSILCLTLNALLATCQFATASEKNWTPTELAIIESLSLNSLPAPPASPSNRYADNKAAQTLGQQLFFDTQFSGNQALSCASCHQVEKFFTDGLPLAKGLHATGRNTPTVVASAWQRWFYWDGRKDSLWSQALIPFEASNEMGSSRTSVVNKVMSLEKYQEQYVDLFGPFPTQLAQIDLTLNAGPLGNTPMQNNWSNLNKEAQQSINQVYVNIGKALEAYQRTLTYQPTVFDRYAEQLRDSAKNNTSSDNASDATQTSILSEDEIAGLKLFINAEKTQCLQCHNTALFSNRGFHNVGSGTFSGEGLDFGRMLGLQAVLIDEFNCLGPYSDAKQNDCAALKFLNKRQHIPLQGAFKTPGLRHLSQTAPYFHDGRFNSLEEVVEFYNNPPQSNGPHELQPMGLDDSELNQLVLFLLTLK